MRDYQEDALGFLQAGDSLSGGVFDGHGGDHVSRELERCLLQVSSWISEGSHLEGSVGEPGRKKERTLFLGVSEGCQRYAGKLGLKALGPGVEGQWL